MTEKFYQAIERVRLLPPEKQDEIARIMLEFADAVEPPVPPKPDRPQIGGQQVTVPDVVGMDISKAREVINSVRGTLVIGDVSLPDVPLKMSMTEEHSSSEPAGTVVRQSPRAGERVLIRSVVEVIVAK